MSEAITAASAPFSFVQKTTVTSTSRESAWKSDAWEYFDMVGELSFVCQWLAHSLSRVTIVPSDIDPDTLRPIGTCEDELARELAADIAGGPAGQGELLSRLAVFLTVPGEGFVAIIHPTDQDGRECEEWHVLSDEEIKKKRADGRGLPSQTARSTRSTRTRTLSTACIGRTRAR